MPEPQDGATTRPFTHANPVTQAGFTMIPNAVMLRRDLKPVSKLIYGYLKHLAWREGTDGEAGPPRALIASDLNIAEDTVRLSIRELQKAPCLEGDEREDAPMLVVAKRRGLGRTNVYLLHDPLLKGGDFPSSGSLDFSDQESPNPAVPAGARLSGSKTKETRGGANAPPREDCPPALTLIDGRNVALDALAEVTGVEQGSPRYPQAVVALNGRKTPKTEKLTEPGIRHLFWRELLRWAAEHDPDEERLQVLEDEPERFERALERGIRRKAALYRERMPGATLTPKALHDWWLDVERIREREDGGLTPAEMATFPA